MKASYGILLACLGLVHCGGGDPAAASSAKAATIAPPVTAALSLAPVECAADMPPPRVPPVYPRFVKPPVNLPDGVIADGEYDWAAGYTMQAYVDHLRATGDQAWAARLIDAAEHLLAQRDAVSPIDHLPYAWNDLSYDVGHVPYVWSAFVGHLYAPLMQFGRLVAADPQLAACTYQGRTLADYTQHYLAEFNRALAVHRSEVRTVDGSTYAVFGLPMPTAVAQLQGLVQPANMNADLFLAILHAIPVENVFGSPAAGQEKAALVEGQVHYLETAVLRHVACSDGRDCLLWNYAPYMPRTDDIGHGNIVAKFLYDARDDGYAVPTADLVALANTMDNLLDANGSTKADLLDGTTINGVAASLYYYILYGRYLPALQVKMDRMVLASRNFPYTGTWLLTQP